MAVVTFGGAECIISGIRSEVAQTVVHLGIDLFSIVTKASLASALKYAFGLLKMKVKNLKKIKLFCNLWMVFLFSAWGSFYWSPFKFDLYGRLATNLDTDLVHMVNKTGASSVLIDISALSIVASFMGRILGNFGSMSKIMDAETMVVGMQPAVAITLIELGLELKVVHKALKVERGMDLLKEKIGSYEDEEPDEDEISSEQG